MRLSITMLSTILVFASGEPIGTETKIIGGHNAELGQFKYMVSLRSNNQHFCGGSIISPRTILTAAHCNTGHILEMTAVIGTINAAGGGVAHRVSKIIAHEGYNSEIRQHDIALVILSSDIIFSDDIQPISLPTYDIGDDVLVTATGWGLTSYPGSISKQLQYINVRTVSRRTCQNMHPNGTVFASHICTLTKSGAGICSGDFGGPIVAKSQVHGVASFSHLCAAGHPDFFTRVNSYKSWIKQNMI